MGRVFRVLVVFFLAVALFAGAAGWILAPNFLHPFRRPLAANLTDSAAAEFLEVGAHLSDVSVRALDGVPLRGWLVEPAHPNGSWVLLFHGVGDNRAGMTGYARFILEAGYGTVLMYERAQGESGGTMATYGWLESKDTAAVLDWLVARKHPRHVFAFGESMGAGIALQSAAADERIEGVVAEAAFANLREAAYDYAGMQRYAWLGKTVLAPAAWALLFRGERLSEVPLDEVAPEHAVAARSFPALIICDGEDHTLPCRHSERIYRACRGRCIFWQVPGAIHTGAFGSEPVEFEQRVLVFLNRNADNEPRLP